ncbi:MAG: helix-turn-helix domain-containing protein [Sulfurimonadaceae bacterium]
MYVTIQKLSKDTGVNASTIQKMIKQGELTPYKKEGLKRIFINPQEFFSQLRPVTDAIDLDRFLI